LSPVTLISSFLAAIGWGMIGWGKARAKSLIMGKEMEDKTREIEKFFFIFSENFKSGFISIIDLIKIVPF
jgi:hypothetical protein